jgi:membrane protein DedA with SNARE-associated domain
MLESITEWATDLMETLGGPGAGLAIALENLFPPIPSEVILPLAGFTAARGELSLVSAILWTTAGSVFGAVALYFVGALLGRDRTRAIAARLPLIRLTDIDRTEAWFARNGTKAIFFGRMIPIFRSLISIPAGIERMPIPVFVTFTAFGSLIWNSTFIFAGYALGANWRTVEHYVGLYSKGVLLVAAIAFAAFLVLRLRQASRVSK